MTDQLTAPTGAVGDLGDLPYRLGIAAARYADLEVEWRAFAAAYEKEHEGQSPAQEDWDGYDALQAALEAVRELEEHIYAIEQRAKAHRDGSPLTEDEVAAEMGRLHVNTVETCVRSRISAGAEPTVASAQATCELMWSRDAAQYEARVRGTA